MQINTPANLVDTCSAGHDCDQVIDSLQQTTIDQVQGYKLQP